MSIPAWYGRSSSDFVADLREAAIKGGMKTAFIDMIDELDTTDYAEEIDKLGDELSQAEKDRDDLLHELETLCKAIDENLDPDKSPAIERALEFAQKAVERHS